jgi:pimeloyl-ACP methyl ester carboxylesterase
MVPTDSLEKLDLREVHFRVLGPIEGLKLFLRHLAPVRPAGRTRAVLYVHGMSFPSALSIAHRFDRFDGRSWRDELCDIGFDVWGLDFYGFGYSDRYAEMSQPSEQNPPSGQAAEISQQLEFAARFICAQNTVPRLSLIGNSGGTIGTAMFGIRNPDPSRVRAPIAIIRGEWDSMCTDADARWSFDALSRSPTKRDVKISRPTHLMHLEKSPYALYREPQKFLEGETSV